MATQRDLLEAEAHTRRRLAAAFASGAAGGRQVEPRRPVRTVLAGVALALLLLAGAAVAGVLGAPDQEDRSVPTPVVERQAGPPAVTSTRARPARPARPADGTVR